MSRFQETEQEWRELFDQWKEALASGDKERERELWAAMGLPPITPAVMDLARAFRAADPADVGALAGAVAAIPVEDECFLDLGELDALADELEVAV